MEPCAGRVSVLLALKAAVDHGVDLRNHDRERTWVQGYADNRGAAGVGQSYISVVVETW